MLQNREAYVNVMNLWVAWKLCHFLTSWVTTNFSTRLLSKKSNVFYTILLWSRSPVTYPFSCPIHGVAFLHVRGSLGDIRNSNPLLPSPVTLYLLKLQKTSGPSGAVNTSFCLTVSEFLKFYCHSIQVNLAGPLLYLREQNTIYLYLCTGY